MTDATDNFNRASIGTNWTQSTSFLAIGIVGSTSAADLGGTNTDAASWWNANSFGSDHYSEIVVGVNGTVTNGGGPIVRHQSGASTFYEWFLDAAGNGAMQEVTAGTFANLGATYSGQTVTAGTAHRLDATGSTLTPSVNGTPGSTRSDSTITGGAPALHVFNDVSGTKRTYDSWLGGPISGGDTLMGQAIF